MRLTITNFRRYRNKLKLDFKEGITKITGDSGAGKTTIFAALEWCLYGKVRKIKPTGYKGETRVTLAMKMPACHLIKQWLGISDMDVNVVVDRVSSNTVTLTLGLKKFEDHDAQARIDAIFGDADLFKVTSYLRAEEMHPMLVSTPGAKREITSILFPDAAKHSIYKERIATIRKELASQLNETSMKMARVDGVISTIEDHHPWVKEDQVNDGDVPDAHAIQASIAKERKAHADASRQTERWKALIEEKASISEPADTAMHEEELETIRSKLQQSVVDVASREARLSSINDRLASIDLASIPTRDECAKASADCMAILSLGLGKFSLDQLETMRKEKQVLEAELKSCGHTDGKDYSCPACASDLYMLNGALVTDKPQVSGVDPSSIKRKVAQLDTKIGAMEEAMEKYGSYQGKDIRSLMAKMNEYISLHDEHARLGAQIEAIPPMPDTYITPSDKAEHQARMNKLNSFIKRNLAQKERLIHLESSIKEMEELHPWVKDDAHLGSIMATISKLEEKMARSIEAKKRQDIKEKHGKASMAKMKLDHVIIKVREKIDACARLTSIIDDVYGQYVGSMLKSIEHDISTLAKIMFDRTMNVSLHASTTTVSGMTKPSFDMRIQYQGVEYDDVRSMSTGEKKRLSIILMIVLTKYTDGRIMLLDEALTSVGMEQRGLIMNEINRLGIPILITSHDDVPGGYDNEMIIDGE